MTEKRHDEASFESTIETALLTTGWHPLDKSTYDLSRHLFPKDALAFIRATQPKEWARLEALNGAQTEAQILKDLIHWLDHHGTLAVLRNGFKCQGRTLRMAFFKPAHGMNPELAAHHAANRLGVTRQLRYSSQNTNELDLVLSVNGLPVATVELKNPMTGQTVEHAKQQYRQDRDHREPLFEFKRRALVHFAVDTEQVFMTTRLAGSATHFLPFNQGHDGGAGNPPAASGQHVRTAYLWQEVWQPDSWLDILARFIHLQVEDKRGEDGRRIRKETLVFPRYHQLKAVRALEAMAKAEGPGQNYLIEHSAGSGKSNTIAWLAHRLASLHNEQDQKVFDSVIVITDRRVLDRQLQDTIYQFEHRQGVVQKIDDDSRQLAEALTGGVPIIISTLQKFPFVTRQLLKMAEERGAAGGGVLPTKRCAVIIDEAHSSQSGESATDLKEVLGGNVLREQAAQYAADDGVQDLDALYRSMAKRGQQANISFFAFTATPKHKTLAVFGRDLDGKSGQPFHRYTMRQAIEEGFIMDVLKHYTTYATYYKLLKAGEDDPNVERKQAAKALARFMRLHPYNIAQKTEVMVEHFNAATRHKLGGKAKAMVVTGSRLEAVRYKQAFDAYIRAKGYAWIKTLVAFSGEVVDQELPDKVFTEVGMNGGIKEGELPEQFDSPDYQVLLVAEKYQTGFDQPLLHTMYVDKRLAGIQAVQTLSRLNRMHPLKEDTFVLDFVNDRDEIQGAFKQFFDGAVFGEEAEPNQMYAIKAELDASGIYQQNEVDDVIAIYFKPRERQSPADHQAMNAALDPAVDRFRALLTAESEQAELWRSKLNAFRNLYAFLSQVIPYQDSELERLYTYFRLLSPKLPTRGIGPQYSFDDDVRLAYYRLQKISEGSISLNSGTAMPLDGPKAVGSGQMRDEEVPLSRLIDVMNDRFGTDFTDADQLFFDQIIEAAMGESSLREAAQANPEDKFSLLFAGMLDTLFIERMEQNEDIFARFMNEKAFKDVVADWVSAPFMSDCEPLAPSVNSSVDSMTPQTFQAAIIDLDGTMVDTLGDFHVVLQHTLADMGCHPIEIARVDRDFLSLTVGKGTEDLLRRSLAHAWGLPEDDRDALDAVPAAWQHYQRHYDRLNGQHADVFPGVPEALQQLRDLGVPLACLTNKPTAFAEQLLTLKGLRGHFQHVFGGDAFERKKPDPLPLLKTCEALSSEPAATLMVGDSSNDAQAARAAGCPVLLVTYGYNHGHPITEVPALAHVDRLDAVAWADGFNAR